METFLEERERAKSNAKIYLIGALIGVVLIGTAIWLVTGPSMQEQMANILEGSYHEGSPEFEQLTKDIIISTGDNTVESPNAFGTISMFIQGKIRNKGNRVINGLEVNAAVVNQFNDVLKEKRVLVVPTQQARLMPGETIPITLSVDGFSKKDDRANIRWKVTAIRTEN
jgi:hypothetical protein